MMRDDWKKSTVGHLFDVQLGKMLNEKAKTGPQFPYLANFNVRWGNFDFSKLNEMTFSDREKEKYSLQKGDLLMCEGGEIGRCAIWLGSESEIYYQKALHRVRSKNKDGFTKYLYFYMQFIASQGKLVRLVGETSIAHLTREKLLGLPLTHPPLPEQKALADLLSTWDEAIGKTEQLIATKQKFYETQLSKRLLHGFPEQIKLKKFLKEVSKRNRGLSITQVLSVTNSRGFVRPEEQFDRPIASDNLSNYKIISKGEYAYNPSRVNVGSIARLDDWDYGVLSPMYTVFEIKKSSNLHTDLFLHWLNSHEAKQRIKLSAQGSVRETVSFDDFCAIGFPNIEFKEQMVLAEYFNLILKEVETLKSIASKYKTQKRGLMQKVLPGKWRVKPEIVNKYMEA